MSPSFGVVDSSRKIDKLFHDVFNWSHDGTIGSTNASNISCKILGFCRPKVVISRIPSLVSWLFSVITWRCLELVSSSGGSMMLGTDVIYSSHQKVGWLLLHCYKTSLMMETSSYGYTTSSSRLMKAFFYFYMMTSKCQKILSSTCEIHCRSIEYFNY